MSTQNVDSLFSAFQASIESLRRHLAASDSIQDVLRLKLKYADQLAEALNVTNEHLYYGWTPLATFITALGVLFAAGAIVAGFLIYREGKDSQIRLAKWHRVYRTTLINYKAKFEAGLRSQQDLIKEFLDEKAQHVDNLINELGKANNHQSEIEQTLIQLKVERDRLAHLSDLLKAMPATISNTVSSSEHDPVNDPHDFGYEDFTCSECEVSTLIPKTFTGEWHCPTCKKTYYL